MLDNGAVLCWGLNTSGQLDGTPGAGATGTPSLGPGRTAVAISAGGSHTCAVLDDGSVRCWGANSSGQLGFSGGGSIGNVNLGGAGAATAISAGSTHTCAVHNDASIRCWGEGDDGRLGYGNTADLTTPSATPVNTVGTPTGLATNPASTGNNNSPKVSGSAEAGSTVKLYTNSACTGAIAGLGSAATFAGPGITVSVADDSTTTFYATATDAAGNVSDCSTAFGHLRRGLDRPERADGQLDRPRLPGEQRQSQGDRLAPRRARR